MAYDEESERTDNDPNLDSAALRLMAFDALADGIWVSDVSGDVLYRNPVATSMEKMFWSRGGLVGTMGDLVFGADLAQRPNQGGHWAGEYHLSGDSDGEHQTLRSVVMEIRSLRQDDGQDQGVLFHARDVSNEWWREQKLQDRHIELEQAYSQLKLAQTQLLQSEKMASIGQLAAGVAHEINNPIGYVRSNLSTLQTYANGLLELVSSFDEFCESLPIAQQTQRSQIEGLKKKIDFSYLKEDLPQLLTESRDGIERVKKIVLDLRDLSHAGQTENDEWTVTDIHRGIESVLNIVASEMKYKAEVKLNLGAIPPIECMASQLNQVFLNLLINATQAIVERGTIEISTYRQADEICITITDSGQGISAADLPRIFDPFFTTKPVGKGTGLGLSLSYGIIKKHKGRIEVDSKIGVGTSFRIFLPVHRDLHTAD